MSDKPALMSREEIEAFREGQRSILTGVMHPTIDGICDLAISGLKSSDIYDKAIEDAAQAVEKGTWSGLEGQIAEHIRQLKGKLQWLTKI